MNIRNILWRTLTRPDVQKELDDLRRPSPSGADAQAWSDIEFKMTLEVKYKDRHGKEQTRSHQDAIMLNRKAVFVPENQVPLFKKFGNFVPVVPAGLEVDQLEPNKSELDKSE